LLYFFFFNLAQSHDSAALIIVLLWSQKEFLLDSTWNQILFHNKLWRQYPLSVIF